MMQEFWTLGFFIVILGLGLWLYRKRTKAYQKFPTFSVLFLLVNRFLFRRHIPMTAYVFQKFVEFSKRCEQDGVFLIWGFEPILFIFSEEAIKIFSNEKAALDKPPMYESLKGAFGEGTVTSNGDTWKKRRKMFNPVFYQAMLKSKVFTCNKHARLMIEDLAMVTNKPIDILGYVKKCSISVICETILGMKMQGQKDEKRIQTYMSIVTKLCQCTTYRISLPWMRYQMFLHCTAYGREFLKCYKERSRVLSEILLDLKESAFSLSPELNSEDDIGKSFVEVLIEHHLNDPTFTKKDMEDEISTYVASGFDTISYALMWSLFLLGHHQDIQNRVFKEVQSETEEFVTYNDICKLRYLECVIKESLRLYPPVPLFGRHLKKDVRCGKYNVPKDTTIIFFPYTLHRNSKIFPDPESFNPDRFFSRNLENHPWSYIPFSEGIRNCIGKKFAIMEMKIILAYIIRNYELKSLDERDSVELNWEVTLMPTKPLNMQLIPRKP